MDNEQMVQISHRTSDQKYIKFIVVIPLVQPDR